MQLMKDCEVWGLSVIWPDRLRGTPNLLSAHSVVPFSLSPPQRAAKLTGSLTLERRMRVLNEPTDSAMDRQHD
jgi:hypothetical protein